MTRGTSKTCCNHLPSGSREHPPLVQQENELCKHEGYEMSNVHAVAARPSSCVEKKGFSLFIPIKDVAEITDNGHP